MYGNPDSDFFAFQKLNVAKRRSCDHANCQGGIGTYQTAAGCFSKLKGKEIRFVEFSDGFLLSLFSLNYLPLPNWQI
ncbi:MAG: hypothetical protein R2941_08400 [Desulfobacterales bacterium]